MWYYLGAILLSLHLIQWLLQNLRRICEQNRGKAQDVSEKVANRHWHRVGLKDTVAAIVKGLTVQRGMPNYEWLYQNSKQMGPLLWTVVPTAGRHLGSINGHLDLCKKIMGSSSLWPDRLYDNHYIHTASFNNPLGLLFGTGEHYKRANRLTLKLLHQFEFFKPSRMESFVNYEISEIETSLQKKLSQCGGQYTFSTHGMFQIATLNTIWLLIAGKRFSSDDPLAHEMIDSWNKANREQSIGFTILEILPFLKYFPRLTFLQSTQHMSNITYEHFRNRIREIREEWKTLNYHEIQPTNLMEGFLREVDKPENKNDPYLTVENVITVMRDMLIAGADTVNSAMEFALFYMALIPQIQAKVQTEIEQVIGDSTTPSYTDKDRMPYTQAVLLEVLRIACPVPATGRAAAMDNEINGVKFPKGSFLALNIYALHRDDSVWEDPFDFKPERFLDGDGKLANLDKMLVFGYGKRSCTGESVARVSLFLFFVTLMQRFTFELSSKHCPPSNENMVGLTRSPQKHFVTVRRRE